MAEMQRQTAIKANIATLLAGQYIKGEGWNPNYLDTKQGPISRAHLVGVVVEHIHDQEFLIDDGTGKIRIRAFSMEHQPPGIGQLVRIIGRPREYQDHRYVLPEIIKPLDNPLWGKLHQQQTAGMPEPASVEAPKSNTATQQNITSPEGEISTNPPEGKLTQKERSAESSEVSPQANVATETPPGGQDPHTIVYTLVKTLDKGEGADHESVIAKSQLSNAESIIDNLMKEGELFLIAPGRLKVLE